MVLCLICNFPHKLVRGMQLLHLFCSTSCLIG
ncbi:unnamed protein product [Brugia pahangi]|uniref:Transcriptional regulator n=1 Tax=Brugia pahangi TaxID=6280 RepID=A0A0N4T047_BRUPA|nr:unnamed protein product [Brugia pahangi]